MPAERKVYTAEFKAKVALEAIRGVKTASELASDYGVNRAQIARWKKIALEGLEDIFSDKPKKVGEDDQATLAFLHLHIDRLKAELDWLKKISGLTH